MRTMGAAKMAQRSDKASRGGHRAQAEERCWTSVQPDNGFDSFLFDNVSHGRACRFESADDVRPHLTMVVGIVCCTTSDLIRKLPSPLLALAV